MDTLPAPCSAPVSQTGRMLSCTLLLFRSHSPSHCPLPCPLLWTGVSKSPTMRLFPYFWGKKGKEETEKEDSLSGSGTKAERS